MARVSPPSIGKPMAEVMVLCPNCRKPNQRTEQTIQKARFCQHCGHDIVLNNPGPRYYITRVIKEGGQGAVYETISDDWRTYAVKEMLDRFSDPKERAEATERFAHEAELLTRLRHPRIPRVYASFEDDGRHYLAMEFVRGEDLEQIVERDGAIPEATVLGWADQICDVLDYLHTNNLIYRDMKPSNVMVERQGNSIKIVDFGIAKVFQHTERGTQIGTPGYAPPEQYQGLATIESDIYALGATLHHLLSGRDPRDEAPFSFPSLRDLNPQVSQRTADAIARALQMKPEDRFQSVAEFRAALRPMPAALPQVRVAPSVQPQAARPSNQPADARAAASPVAVAPTLPRPTQPLPRPPQPLAPPPTATQPGWFRRFVAFVFRTTLVLVLVAGLAGAALYFAFPEVISEYAPGVLPMDAPTAQPTAQPTSQPLASQPFTADDLQVTVPEGADDATIRQAFVDAYTQVAQTKFGASTRISSSAPVTYIGGQPEKVGAAQNGQQTYSASLQGFILAPP